MGAPPLQVLFENDDIIAVNKPAGLASQGGSGVTRSADRLLAAQTGGKIFPLHRLDKDTAGVLAAAKSAEAARLWARLLGSRQVKKEYLALCLGTLPAPSGELSTPAGKGRAKDALTEYRVLAVSETDPVFSAVRLTLCTGRTHQIRIHLADAHCPIAGDDKYGDFGANRAIRKAFGIKKLQLAALRLTVPLAGKPFVIEAPLPPHIREALEGAGIAGFIEKAAHFPENRISPKMSPKKLDN
jgi:23S rRNA pseudouridine955/2504/2580 synthase